jgi:hypothetical protein
MKTDLIASSRRCFLLDAAELSAEQFIPILSSWHAAAEAILGSGFAIRRSGKIIGLADLVLLEASSAGKP